MRKVIHKFLHVKIIKSKLSAFDIKFTENLRLEDRPDLYAGKKYFFEVTELFSRRGV